MTPDELRPILTEYRKQVQQAWSKETAHPSFEGSDGSPVGQCGVTSAWLQRRLLEDHGITSQLCGGHVWVTGQFIADNHIWLELGEVPKRKVVDLTASQLRGLDTWPVICSTVTDLELGEILYRAHRWFTTLEVDREFLARLALLEGALS